MLEMQQLWPFLAVGVCVGSMAEWAAYGLNLWRYRSPLFLGLNVWVMFGAVMGGVAASPLSWERQVALAFLVGTFYELLNIFVLHVWTFPGQRIGPVHGRAAISLVLGSAWAGVPLIIGSMARL